MLEALIHRARVVTRARGARDAQGEYVRAEPEVGPWFPARVMERGAVSPKQRRGDSSARVPRGYEVLAFHTADDGSAVVLTASTELETECPILDSPALELDGEPEKLNDGMAQIGWLAYATKPKDRA